jgi:hypothetical protein
MAIAIENIVEAMYGLVVEYHGKKNLKAVDLTRAMIEKFGEDQCDRKACKQAIRELIESGKCVYSYLGDSYIVINPDRPNSTSYT